MSEKMVPNEALSSNNISPDELFDTLADWEIQLKALESEIEELGL